MIVTGAGAAVGLNGARAYSPAWSERPKPELGDTSSVSFYEKAPRLPEREKKAEQVSGKRQGQQRATREPPERNHRHLKSCRVSSSPTPAVHVMLSGGGAYGKRQRRILSPVFLNLEAFALSRYP